MFGIKLHGRNTELSKHKFVKVDSHFGINQLLELRRWKADMVLLWEYTNKLVNINFKYPHREDLIVYYGAVLYHYHPQ